MLNDYTYLSDPAKASDSRWVHHSRRRRRWEAREDLTDQDTLEWRFFHEMVKLIGLRKQLPALQNGGMEVVATGNAHLFGYVRTFDSQKILIVNNFSEQTQKMAAAQLAASGVKKNTVNLLTGETVAAGSDLVLGDYQSVWLDITEAEADAAP